MPLSPDACRTNSPGLLPFSAAESSICQIFPKLEQMPGSGIIAADKRRVRAPVELDGGGKNPAVSAGFFAWALSMTKSKG
jgi:hypothetical protein